MAGRVLQAVSDRVFLPKGRTTDRAKCFDGSFVAGGSRESSLQKEGVLTSRDPGTRDLVSRTLFDKVTTIVFEAHRLNPTRRTASKSTLNGRPVLRLKTGAQFNAGVLCLENFGTPSNPSGGES